VRGDITIAFLPPQMLQLCDIPSAHTWCCAMLRFITQCLPFGSCNTLGLTLWRAMTRFAGEIWLSCLQLALSDCVCAMCVAYGCVLAQAVCLQACGSSTAQLGIIIAQLLAVVGVAHPSIAPTQDSGRHVSCMPSCIG